MSFSISECCTPCAEETTTNIPGVPGTDGADGAVGADGANAFTVTTADFDVQPPGNSWTIEVETTAWMAEGQPIFIPGAGFFTVVAIISGVLVAVNYPAWEENTHDGDTILAGTAVVPSGWQPAAPSLPAVDAISQYGVGTVYPVVVATADILTDPAEITFGTSGNQRITLTTAGSWLLQARVRLDYVAATFAAVRSALFQLARQNNTPGAIPNTPTTFRTQIITTLTYTAIDLVFPPVLYKTALTTDIIRMMAAIDTPPSAGALNVMEASLIATYLNAVTA
jgi:hypothetical protein